MDDPHPDPQTSPLALSGRVGGGGVPAGAVPGEGPHPDPSPEGEGLDLDEPSMPGLSLGAVFADAVRRLVRASADRRSALHTPVVITGDGDARIMVLRAADAHLATLRFHTDTRAPKCAVLAADPRLSVLGYDPARRIQLRLSGRARIETRGAVADAAWAAASASSRRCYLAEAGPGAPLDAPGAALPAALRDRSPTLDETVPGRAHFAVLLFRAETLDWLRLGHDGGVRARFAREPAGEWHGQWIAP